MATTEEKLTQDPDVEPRPAAETPAAPAQVDEDRSEETEEGAGRPSPRIAVAVAFPTIAAGVLVGGIFTGFGARVAGVLAGLLGVGLAFGASRLRGRPVLSNLVIIVGLFAIGLILIGPGNITRVQALAIDSARTGDVLRPPVPFDAGWRAIVSWLMGAVGFSAAWVALALRKPALGLLLPLPIAAFAGISIPENQQVGSGIAALLLFAVSLGILSSEQSLGEEGKAPSLSYELRKAAKSVPLLVALGVGLYLLSMTPLFPDTVLDPAQEPQKPKTQPLSQVEDRVLFQVDSELSGPWRIGSLDVYDGNDWRLPPFAASEFEEVPRSGVVDPELAATVQAKFTIAGLGGAVMPALPNTVGIRAEGPKLTYDSRAGNIRLLAGTVEPGLTYTVAAAGLPSVDDLNAIAAYDAELPDSVRKFILIDDTPGPRDDKPPAVADLLERAAQAAPSKWGQFDFARTFVLENVVAKGTGSPVSITPERVQDILAGSQTASPFEIVATQAMLARWMGIPSRIGYGFDGGDENNVGQLEIRPRHGAAFVEVYFPGFKWLPVIGTPRKAEPTVGSDESEQRVDPGILPSDDVSVQIFLPTVVPPESVVGKQVAVTVLIAVIILLILLAAYVLYPALVKARRRSLARTAAVESGSVRARVALAYSEWRDYATDFGFFYITDTPLMFLDRFQDDEEHTELAWLTTRVLWGDLQGVEDPIFASIAEELSRSLRRRLAAAQPATVRAVSLVSRLSLRNPYAPETDLSARGTARLNRKETADATVR